MSTVLSSLGGALSLYLGVAIILLFELIEMGARIVMNACRGTGKAAKKRQEKKKEVKWFDEAK